MVLPGQVWKKSDHERIRVEEVVGATVSGTLSDTTAGSTSIWVGSPDDFAGFILVEEPSQS
jgi:hypothetical protein